MLETKTAAFTFVKQGIFYFSRRVPSDLSHHYDTDGVRYSHRLRSQSLSPSGLSGLQPNVSHTTVRLSEAVGIHLRLKGQGRPVIFHSAAEPFCGYVIDICGDKDITAYTKADTNAFRDNLLSQGDEEHHYSYGVRSEQSDQAAARSRR